MEPIWMFGVRSPEMARLRDCEFRERICIVCLLFSGRIEGCGRTKTRMVCKANGYPTNLEPGVVFFARPETVQC